MFLCFSSRESCQASQNRKIHCFWVVCLFASVFPCFCFVLFCFCFFCFVVCLSSLVSGFLIYFLFVCLFVYSLPMSSLLHFLFVCLFVACVFPGFWFVCLFVCGFCLCLPLFRFLFFLVSLFAVFLWFFHRFTTAVCFVRSCTGPHTRNIANGWPKSTSETRTAAVERSITGLHRHQRTF